MDRHLYPCITRATTLYSPVPRLTTTRLLGAPVLPSLKHILDHLPLTSTQLRNVTDYIDNTADNVEIGIDALLPPRPTAVLGVPRVIPVAIIAPLVFRPVILQLDKAEQAKLNKDEWIVEWSNTIGRFAAHRKIVEDFETSGHYDIQRIGYGNGFGAICHYILGRYFKSYQSRDVNFLDQVIRANLPPRTDPGGIKFYSVDSISRFAHNVIIYERMQLALRWHDIKNELGIGKTTSQNLLTAASLQYASEFIRFGRSAFPLASDCVDEAYGHQGSTERLYNIIRDLRAPRPPPFERDEDPFDESPLQYSVAMH